MKRLVPLILTVLLLLGTMSAVPVSAAAEYEFFDIQFFEAGYNEPPEAEKKYDTAFEKSNTRYVWARLKVINKLYNVRSHSHNVVWRYYNSDGSLRGETDGTFTIKPEWYYAWIPAGWGWTEPGNWPVGTYTVAVLVDGTEIGRSRFTIYDERPTLEFRELNFFEAARTPPSVESRSYRTNFARSSRTIHYQVTMKNLLYGIRDQEVELEAVYYYPDGSIMGEPVMNYTVPKTWDVFDLWHGWGWDKTGNWKPGRYRVEIYNKGRFLVEGYFTIRED